MYQDNPLQEEPGERQKSIVVVKPDEYDKFGNDLSEFRSGIKPCENPSTWDNLIAWATKKDNNRFKRFPYYTKKEETGKRMLLPDEEEMLLVQFQLRQRPQTDVLEDFNEDGTSYIVNCYEGYFIIDVDNKRASHISISLPALLDWLDSYEKLDGDSENAGRPLYPHKLQTCKGYKGQSDTDRLIRRRKHRLRGKVESNIKIEDYRNVSSWDDIIKRVNQAHYVAFIYDGEWESLLAAVLLENFGIHHRVNTEILFGTRGHDFIVYCEEGVFTISKDKKWACLISRTLPGALGYLGFEEMDPEGEDKECGKPYFE